MFGKLRIRFILISMLSVTLVLGVIIAGINILSYRSTVDNADMILNMLAENGGRFPEWGGEGESDAPPMPLPGPGAVTSTRGRVVST